MANKDQGSDALTVPRMTMNALTSNQPQRQVFFAIPYSHYSLHHSFSETVPAKGLHRAAGEETSKDGGVAGIGT
jgi:hypothetical protein